MTIDKLPAIAHLQPNPSNQHPSVPSLAPPAPGSVLTIPEVATELRCSRSHVYNILNNRVPGVSPLPFICLGRKKLVRRAALEAWKRANEANTLGDILVTEPEVNTVGA